MRTNMDKEFGNNLRKLRKEKNLTLEELANAINKRYDTSFNKSMISRWENGSDANLSSVKYLSLFFNVSLNEMLGFNEEIYDLKEFGKTEQQIPIVGTVSAGEPILAEQNIIGYASKPPLTQFSDNVLQDLFYLKVKGDSMDRLYPDGSIVLIRRNINIENGDIAIISLESENEATLKKVKFKKRFLELIPLSYNPIHQSKTIDLNAESIKLIGKVIGHISMD